MTFSRQLFNFSKIFNSTPRNFSTHQARLMPQLQEVVKQLNLFANENIAEKWDNVGLIIEPYTPR